MIFPQSRLASAARALCITSLLMITGCAGLPVDQVYLMPAPDVYGDGLLKPLPEKNPMEDIPYNGILLREN